VDRSDWGDDDAEGFRPPLPPEDRVWRHPSELGSGFVAAPPAPPTPRSKGPLVVAVVAAGLLLVVATGASVRFMTSTTSSAATNTTLASLVRTSATIDPAGARTAGVASPGGGSERQRRKFSAAKVNGQSAGRFSRTARLTFCWYSPEGSKSFPIRAMRSRRHSTWTVLTVFSSAMYLSMYTQRLTGWLSSTGIP
jgi:hypothetical protein